MSSINNISPVNKEFVMEQQQQPTLSEFISKNAQINHMVNPFGRWLFADLCDDVFLYVISHQEKWTEQQNKEAGINYEIFDRTNPDWCEFVRRLVLQQHQQFIGRNNVEYANWLNRHYKTIVGYKSKSAENEDRLIELTQLSEMYNSRLDNLEEIVVRTLTFVCE